eukprot:TRINITY_DN4401_c0_g1_i1.p1 TRINITY_DN4401_c0_g1~~TRINITY_DN4401_c0_g1_i1.p1  ORF type:complete len:230 (-),score=59.68 TRINITY_DN4401_c0_g1_i1:397-1086(-)
MAEADSVTLARVAERAERYDEMSDFMKERVETGVPLNPEERDMFSAAFKNALTARRHAVRVAIAVADQEQQEGREGNANLANSYRTKVENELQEICDKALTLLKNILTAAASPGEAKTFYLKMQGDYYRYLSEFTKGGVHDQAAQDASQAYSLGLQEAQALAATHPVRLGLALNYSVFQHEVLRDTHTAVATATQALLEAKEYGISAEDTDAQLTMQLLSDNLTLWGGS